MAQQVPGPSPELFFETANAYQRTAALKAAIELDVFTAIAGGSDTAPQVAAQCGAAERGVRILCDYLTIIGFLTKDGQRYGLTPDTAVFLDRRSPAYMGGTIDFLLNPMLMEHFADLAENVRRGGAAPAQSTLEPEHPVWVKFARAMAPMMAMPSQLLAQLVNGDSREPLKVLDIAAGHGLFGIAFARQNPEARVVALDWANVLAVAQENAAAAGVADRFSTIAGSAFDADFAAGDGYDVILLPNFLHHFDAPTCEGLLRKVYAALKQGGRAVILEFIPNDDRISPPAMAAFSLTMLGSTPAGDTYTFADLEHMAANAGFARSELHPLLPGLQRVAIAYK